MTVQELMTTVSGLVRLFDSPLFVAFSAMIAFSVGLGVKRLILE